MPRARPAPTKIGVVFGPLDEVVQDILSYLLIYQNALQKTFEFRILPAPSKEAEGEEEDEKENDEDYEDEFFTMLSSGPDHITVEREIGGFVDRLRASNEASAKAYRRSSEWVDRVIVLADAHFSDNYYYVGNEAGAVIALGGWEQEFAPPSIVEYFLSFVTSVSLDTIVDALDSHFETRGCISDFNASLHDARLSVLSGHICDSCAKKIEQATSKHVVADVRTLLNRTWLGTAAAPSDVALNVKKLGYDLFHTSGVKPTWIERLRSVAEQEGLKNVFHVTFQLILTGILILLGWKILK